MFTVNIRKTWIFYGLILVGLALTIIGLHKKVELIVDGQSRVVNTWAFSVNQLLVQQDVEINQYDQINPELDSYLPHGSSVLVTHASTIQVEVDGKEIVLYATDPVPGDLLKQAGILLAPGDVLFSDGFKVPIDTSFQTHNGFHFWQLKRALPFTLQDGTEVKMLASTAATVGQALWEAGVRLMNGDLVIPGESSPLTPNLQITVQKARPVEIQTQKNAFYLQTSATTISEALVEAGLSLQGLDYTIPDEEEDIPTDGKFKLVRVAESLIIEQAPVPFETTYQAVDDLEIDRQTVVEAGKYGIDAKRIRIRYEDGQEVSRQVEAEWQAVAPQDRIIGYGTQIVLRSIETPDGTIDYWRALDVYAVSYKPSDTGGNITATGQVLKKGIIAVNPNYIPYGTVLYVPGYGYGVAADTGRLSARMIDLGYTDQDYVSWHQNLTVYFVWPPPANVVWIIP